MANVETPHISVWLDGRGRRQYYPGETLAGSYLVESVGPDDIRAIEVSVMWYTDGKGDEDMAVHQFWRLSSDRGDWIDPRRPGRFSTQLPNTPLSYDGAIMSLKWCVRARVFLHGGRELLDDLPFLLGDVPPVRMKKK